MKVLHDEWVHRTRFDPLRPGLTVERTIDDEVKDTIANHRRELLTSRLRHERMILRFRLVTVLVFGAFATWIMPTFIGVTVVWTALAIASAHKVRGLRREIQELTAPPAKLLR